MHLASSIDPALWREETERVAKQLAQASARAGLGQGLAGVGGGGWSEHLLAMRRIVGDCYERDAEAGKFAFISQSLGALDAAIRNELDSTRRAEGLVNARQSVSSLGAQYGAHRKGLTELEARTGAASRKVAEQSEALAALDDKLGELGEKLEERASAGEGAGGGGGGGTVVGLREGIRKLKEDIVHLSRTVGLLDASLLQKRQASARARGKRSQGRRSGAKTRDDSLEDFDLV